MPSIRDQVALIDELMNQVIMGVNNEGDLDQINKGIEQASVAVAQLSLWTAQMTTRYDYWRRQYCAKAGMSESDFDAMTDECIAHESEPETPCQHLVVNSIGRCANCGKRV